MKRSAGYLCSFAAGFIAALFTTFVWFVVPPASSLTRDLPPNWAAASATFDARVRARFPIGMPIWTLSKELEREGFRPGWFDDRGGYEEYVAERITGNLACGYSARIRWRLDEQGRISSIRGLRRETCL